MQGYRILDEPRPGAQAHLSVNPFWILLSVMMGGAWLAWPWFVFNSFAIGSATRIKEIALVVFGVIGSAALYLGILALVTASVIDERSLAYALLAIVTWKVGISYALQVLQSRSFQLYEYFGGPSKSGVLMMVVGFMLRGAVLERLDGSLWLIVFM
jgi:hypothetical protein